MNKMKVGLIIAIAGITIVVFGNVWPKDYITIRYTGYAITLMGLIIAGNRIYQKVQAKAMTKKAMIKD